MYISAVDQVLAKKKTDGGNPPVDLMQQILTIYLNGTALKWNETISNGRFAYIC